MGRIADALKRAERERRSLRARPEGKRAAASTAPESAGERADLRAKPNLNSQGLAAPAARVESPVNLDEAPDDFNPPPPEPHFPIEGISESIVPCYQKNSLICEQYRSLRTRLISQNPQGEHRVFAITSAIPKEGKSVTTLNLGCIFAEIRHLRVLVVDGDFRRSSLAKMFNQKTGPGLADLLGGNAEFDDIIQPTPIQNLFLMAAGSTNGQSAADLLSTSKCRQIFQRMQNQFHYTIVDTPPASTVTDAGIIGQMCSGVVVIVRLNYTHESTARNAVRNLRANNVPIIGALVIGRDRPHSQYGYGYGYGYYRYYHYNYDYYSDENPK